MDKNKGLTITALSVFIAHKAAGVSTAKSLEQAGIAAKYAKHIEKLYNAVSAKLT